jgi:integrase
MAHLEQRGNRFRVIFRHEGRRYAGALATTDPEDAELLARGVEKMLYRLRHRLIDLPPGADLVSFVLSDGKLTHEPSPSPKSAPADPRGTDGVPSPPGDSPQDAPLTLERLRDRYLQAHGNGAMEENSLETVRMHLRHFEKTLGADFALGQLALEHLQRHLDRRARCKGHHGRRISPVTLRKEVASLRACWNWGAEAGLVTGRFPNRGLRYPKVDEKEPFQTWQEVERRVARGGLTPGQEKALWDCVFLSRTEVEEFLAFARDRTTHPFLYPMFAFACHTGARRSEMLRALIDDMDIEGRTVLLREKKRSKERRTYRRVPLTPFLERVLRDWVAVHPGGQCLFCHRLGVPRSRTRRTEVVPLTRNEANDHFRRTVSGSKWEKLRGWHVFRHSFVSNCAAGGVDQRMIDEWVGHTTEEMRRRYRHLLPDQQRRAIELVFGE